MMDLFSIGVEAIAPSGATRGLGGGGGQMTLGGISSEKTCFKAFFRAILSEKTCFKAFSARFFRILY